MLNYIENRLHYNIRLTVMATFQVAAPEPFNFTKPQTWHKWIQRFDRFRCASGLEDKSGVTQVNCLMHSMELSSCFRLLNLALSKITFRLTMKWLLTFSFIFAYLFLFSSFSSNDAKMSSASGSILCNVICFLYSSTSIHFPTVLILMYYFSVSPL
jgi:hypothetical protein